MAKMLSNIGHLTPDEFNLSVALGHVRHWSIMNDFGMNPDVAAGTEQVWPPGTIQVFPTTAAAVSVVSDSIQDDADLVGTGAHTVVIQGLAADWTEQEEVVTMDGTTPVLTTNTFIRINNILVDDVGTNSVNVGNISASIGGDLQDYIEAEEGHSHNTSYTVPADHTLILIGMTVNTGRLANSDLAFQQQIRPWGKSWLTILDTFPYQGQYQLISQPALLPEKTDIRCIVTLSSGAANCSADYWGYLVHDDPH